MAVGHPLRRRHMAHFLHKDSGMIRTHWAIVQGKYPRYAQELIFALKLVVTTEEQRLLLTYVDTWFVECFMLLFSDTRKDSFIRLNVMSSTATTTTYYDNYKVVIVLGLWSWHRKTFLRPKSWWRRRQHILVRGYEAGAEVSKEPRLENRREGRQERGGGGAVED